MKIRFTIHKDNIFTFFTIDEMCDGENITGDATIEKQLNEIYRIFKLFADNGYKPYISIMED